MHWVPWVGGNREEGGGEEGEEGEGESTFKPGLGEQPHLEFALLFPHD